MARLSFLMWAFLSAGSASAPAEDNTSLRIVRGTGVAEPSLDLPSGRGAAAICASRGPATVAEWAPGSSLSLFPARGVHAATLSVPFTTVSEGSGRCDVELLGVPLGTKKGTDQQFHYGRCSILVRAGSTSVVIAPKTQPKEGDEFILSECIYRLAMYLEGYRGALAEPTEHMFQERLANPQFAGLDYAGPAVPWLPRSLALRCPHLPQLYYRNDLAAAVQRVCPEALQQSGD